MAAPYSRLRLLNMSILPVVSIVSCLYISLFYSFLSYYLLLPFTFIFILFYFILILIFISILILILILILVIYIFIYLFLKVNVCCKLQASLSLKIFFLSRGTLLTALSFMGMNCRFSSPQTLIIVFL